MSTPSLAARVPLRSAGAGRRLGAIGLVLLALLVAVAAAAPLLAPYDPGARVAAPFQPPSLAHPLGTNDVGQDLLSALLYGARVTLAVGLAAATAATVIGATVGLVAGYAGGWVDAALMRLVDVTLALPFLPLMIVVGAFLGPGLATLVLVIAAVTWAGVARELRAQVLSARERDHVQAARAMGAGAPYVLSRHLLRDVAPLVAPEFVLAAKSAIMAEAALSFLGLGDPGGGSWGTMLSFAHARSAFLTDAWLWWVLPPGLCIAAAVLSFALIGYGLEERARPQLRHRDHRTRQRPAHPAPPRGGRASRGATTGAGRSASPEPHGRTGGDRRRTVRSSPPPAGGRGGGPALVADNLSVVYGAGADSVRPVDGVSLAVGRGETLGLVGESGSGKTTLATAAAGMLPSPGEVTAGRLLLDGEDLAVLPPAMLRRLRGDRVALIPQDAMDALNPVLRVGDQIEEAITVHQRTSRRRGRRQARARAGQLLQLVGLDPGRARDYPHQLSGGMRQRVVIAMALAGDPALLIADEPTSGLDVIGQAEVVALLTDLRQRLGLTMLVVSHDLPAVLRMADRMAVMRHGRIIEEGSVRELATRPAHDYTQRLLDATPRLRVPATAAAPTVARDRSTTDRSTTS